MAEAERFELSVGYKPTPVFKTGAFSRSAKLPMSGIITKIWIIASDFMIFYQIFHKCLGKIPILEKYLRLSSGCADFFDADFVHRATIILWRIDVSNQCDNFVQGTARVR